MTWLITGGCGFIGTNLADELLGRGQAVVVLDNMSRVGAAETLAGLRQRHGTDWRFVEADVREAETMARLVREIKPRALAHLAGQVAMTTSIENPRLDFEVNALGTFNVLEAVRLHSPATIVLYSSTNKVYGSLDYLEYEETESRYFVPACPHGLDESLGLEGHSPYGCSKLAADQYGRDYYRMYRVRTVVFRHSSMYGGRQFATYDQGWIGWFCLKALEMADSQAPPFTISGDGKQVRDVLHASDLVAVYSQAVAHIDRAAGQVYNIGGGETNSLSLLELFALLERLTGHKMRYRHLDWRPGDQKYFVADCRQAMNHLHWQPQVGARAGLERMLHWSRRRLAGEV